MDNHRFFGEQCRPNVCHHGNGCPGTREVVGRFGERAPRACDVVQSSGTKWNLSFWHVSLKSRPSRTPKRRCVASAALDAKALITAKDIAVVALKSAQQLVLIPKVWTTLLGTVLPVTIAVAASRATGTGLEADIKVAAARSAVQLFGLSLALKYMFDSRQGVRAVLFIVLMVLAAGHIVGERASKLPQSHLVGVASLVLGSLVPVWLMVALRIFPSSPAFIVPATAHVLGASVIMVGMTLEALHHEVFSREPQIQAALALGATPEQAIRSPLRRALSLGMAPQIDAVSTMGLVSIPGIMTGMIMGGTAPLNAVQQQLQMLNVVVGASALSCMIAAVIGGKMLFSPTFQLLPLRS